MPPENSEVILTEHSTVVGELLSVAHYDVFVRYGYAEALVHGNMDEEYKYWKELYSRMQEARIGYSRTKDFDMLIYSFEKHGFDPKHPIPVDQRYEILDGSHRLACAALFDVRPRVEVYGVDSHMYEREWFSKMGFGEEELQRVDGVREELFSRYKELQPGTFVGIVWGAALDFWEEIIIAVEDPKLRRAFMRDFGENIEEFIQVSYKQDGMPPDRIIDKSKRLADMSTKAGVIAITDTPENVTQYKKDVRERVKDRVEGYFFDCVLHMIDTEDEGSAFLSRYDIKK